MYQKQTNRIFINFIVVLLLVGLVYSLFSSYQMGTLANHWLLMGNLEIARGLTNFFDMLTLQPLVSTIQDMENMIQDMENMLTL